MIPHAIHMSQNLGTVLIIFKKGEIILSKQTHGETEALHIQGQHCVTAR